MLSTLQGVVRRPSFEVEIVRPLTGCGHTAHSDKVLWPTVSSNEIQRAPHRRKILARMSPNKTGSAVQNGIHCPSCQAVEDADKSSKKARAGDF